MRRRSFRRKKRLEILDESDNEPGEEPSPYTSQNLRLGIVQPGQYVEWASLGAGSHTNLNTAWDPNDDGIGDDDLDEDQEAEEGSHQSEGLSRDRLAGTMSPSDDAMIIQMRQEIMYEKHSLMMRMLAEKAEWESTNFTLISPKARLMDAELIRLLFAASGTPLHDYRVSEEEWDSMKDTMPMQTLPLLTKCGVTWGVPRAIVRMLSKKFLLLGKTNDEHLIVDATYERLCRVIMQNNKVINWVIYGENKERLVWAQSQLLHVILPPCLKEWEQLIRLSEGPFIVASGMTLADIAIMNFLHQCSSSMQQIDSLLAEYLAVSDMFTFVRSDIRIGVYYDESHSEN